MSRITEATTDKCCYNCIYWGNEFDWKDEGICWYEDEYGSLKLIVTPAGVTCRNFQYKDFDMFMAKLEC